MMDIAKQYFYQQITCDNKFIADSWKAQQILLCVLHSIDRLCIASFFACERKEYLTQNLQYSVIWATER